MACVFSGVQPTGEGPHIGNYIGAFRRWVDLQDTQDECFYCVVDLHAMTVPWQPKTLAERVRRTAATLIGTGMDPEHSVMYVQTDSKVRTAGTFIQSSLTLVVEPHRDSPYHKNSRGSDTRAVEE